MVTVVFYNLLRSKYRVNELQVHSGTIHQIIAEILDQHPEMSISDFVTSVVFVENKPIHYRKFHTSIADDSRIIITHFVGGG